MSQTDECQTPPTRHVPADHQPDTKRSNERRLWHKMEAGPPLTPYFHPKYSDREDRYDVDRGLETDAKKMRLPTNKTGSKNRSRRSANRRSDPVASEADTLRSELASVHETYRGAILQKDEEIESLKSNLLTMSKLAAQDIDSLQKELTDTLDNLDITEEELTISQKSEKEWIGRTLKLKFIFDQMKKIGALPEDQRETWEPMVEQIDIPEVSINIKDEFVPTAQTDNIDWVSSDDEESDYWESEDEGDIIGDYLENETTINHGLDEHGSMMNVFAPQIDYSYPRAILEKSATTIQKAWQNHQTLKKEQLDRELDDFRYCRRLFNKWEWDSDGFHDDYAIVIQRVWRGHHLRKLLGINQRSVPSGP